MTDKYYTAYHYFRYCFGVSHEEAHRRAIVQVAAEIGKMKGEK